MDVDDQQRLANLAEGARRSDPDAWEELYRLAYSRLLAYAMRRLPTRDDADDAISETFLRAYGSIQRFKPKGIGIVGWLYGILRNVVLEMQRRKRRSEPLSDEEADSGPGPADRLLEAEETAHVRAAFKMLSAEDQELLELRVIGKLGSDEAAKVLGKKSGAVRMGQSRAIARLRTLMTEETRSASGH